MGSVLSFPFSQWNNIKGSGARINSVGMLTVPPGRMRFPKGRIKETIFTPEIPPGEWIVHVQYKSFGEMPSGLRLGYLPSSGGSNGMNPMPRAWIDLYLPVDSKRKWRNLLVRTAESPDPNGELKIKQPQYIEDDGNFWEMPDKKPWISGSHDVSVDPRGLMRIGDKPFVPIGVLANRKRENYKFYSNKGFNTDMWCASEKQARKSIDAGMKFFLGLTQYWWRQEHPRHRKGWAYRNFKQMVDWYKPILNSEMREHCLGFYCDNEGYGQYKDIDDCIRIVRKDLSDDLPIYALQGNFNLSMLWAQKGWSDLTGTYGRPDDSGGAADGNSGHKVLWHHPLQTCPVLMSNHNTNFRIDEVIRDIPPVASGFSYWGDRPDSKIEDKPFFLHMNRFAEEFTAAVLGRHELHKPPIDPPVKPEPDTEGKVERLKVGVVDGWTIYAEKEH